MNLKEVNDLIDKLLIARDKMMISEAGEIQKIKLTSEQITQLNTEANELVTLLKEQVTKKDEIDAGNEIGPSVE